MAVAGIKDGDVNLGGDLDPRRVASYADWKISSEFPGTLEAELGKVKEGRMGRDVKRFSKILLDHSQMTVIPLQLVRRGKLFEKECTTINPKA